MGNDPVNGADPSGNSAICGRDCDETYGSFGDTEASDATLGDQPQTGSVGRLGGLTQTQFGVLATASSGQKSSGSKTSASSDLTIQLAANTAPPGIGHNGGPPIEDILPEIPGVPDGPPALGGLLSALPLLLAPTPAGDENENYFAERAGILIEALSGQLSGQQGLPGTFSPVEADFLGRSFVGPGARAIDEGKGLESADRLRVYRFPLEKGYGGFIGNLEARHIPTGPYNVNIHFTVKP